MTTEHRQRTEFRRRGQRPRSKTSERRPDVQSGDARADKLTEAVIGAAIEYIVTWGRLLRTTYEACLSHELALREIEFERRKPWPCAIEYDIGKTGEVELVFSGVLALKILSVEKPKHVHEAQLISQLKLGRWPFGLLFNFNVPSLPDGIRRLINPKFKEH